MSLLTEQNIETATPASTPSLPPVATPGDAGERTNSEIKSAATSDDLSRTVAEMRNELFNMRTELARSSETLASRVSRMGLLVTVAVVVAAGVIFSSSRAPRAGAPAITIPAQGVADTAAIDALNAAVGRVTERLDEISSGVEAQKKSLTDVAKLAASTPAPPRVAGRTDCAKLPADVRASEADFSIQFQAGSAKILPGSEATLDNVAKMLALVPTNCVLIEGHADASGNTAKNVALSKERASSVLDYVASKANIDRSYLVAIGRGSSNPPAGTDALDPANRRVVFRIVPTVP